jgi:hypothetical protein
MQLAVKTFPQVKQGHAVHVKVVAAAWATGHCSDKRNGEHYEEPEYEDIHYCLERRQ